VKGLFYTLGVVVFRGKDAQVSFTTCLDHNDIVFEVELRQIFDVTWFSGFGVYVSLEHTISISEDQAGGCTDFRRSLNAISMYFPPHISQLVVYYDFLSLGEAWELT
jgi:hypothetical protein